MRKLTMSVQEYVDLTGVGEFVVRRDIEAGRIPHRKYGRRGIIRILRAPALAQLGYDEGKSA